MDYTAKAREVLRLASKAARSYLQNYIGTEHILLGLIRQGDGIAACVLADNEVDEESVKELIKTLIAPPADLAVLDKEGYSPRAKNVLTEAEKLAKRYGEKAVGTEHLLMGLIKEGDNVAVRLLVSLEVNIQKLYADTLSAIGTDPSRVREDLRLLSEGPMGGGESATKVLDQYSRDLTALAKEGRLDPVIGREDEIRRLIQILSRRTKNNPCLVGEPGVGKTAIVEGLAQRIVDGNVPATMKSKRLVTLDMSGMVAGSKYRGEFEERIKKVMNEVIEAGNVILFMDEIHTLIGAGGAEGSIDASNILKPSLARGELQLIGATTIEEYRKYLEKDAALERRFQKVDVPEPSISEAIAIIDGIKHKYEEHHGVTILPEAVEASVKLSARYINDRNLPDKAIDLIDEAASAIRMQKIVLPAKAEEWKAQIEKLDMQIERSLKFEAFTQAHELRCQQQVLEEKYKKLIERHTRKQQEKSRTVTQDDIAGVVSQWTKVPLRQLSEQESERLLRLEKILHKRVIGQEEAVSALSRAMRRGRVGLQDPNRPIGSFLFLGPTGVGKTELSKALAEVMFGSENELIRVDMSEYMEQHSVAKMIGSPPGYVGHDEGGQLSEKVRRKPYSVVLFDEVEKAHPDVFNVLLQVLDDGHISDSKGRKVSFKNTIIIMTSNAGASRIVDPKNLGFAAEKNAEHDYQKMKSGVMEEVKRIFKPEFINRIDEIMVFHPLEKKELEKIVTLLSKDLSKRCMQQMDITLTVSPALKKYLIDNHCDVKMGARPLKRAIQNVVEDRLAQEILEGKVKSGDNVTATVASGEVVFKVLEEKAKQSK
ncbi:MAG: ATP-dependent Clp protease ATP-binding subunit [Lachnospiraceae bacterium]|nr:ATP-dependent Clp protease ATP-binding subunit [Lachnospiraceae bacterium]